jgi:chaperonin GroEL
MVADVLDRIGLEGNIIVEEFDGIGSYDEEVNGLYFRKGFTDQFLIKNISALESRMEDPDIFITDKPLKSGSDIAPILNKILERAGRGAELLIIGEVTDEALVTLALNKAKENIYPTLVDVPVYGPMRTLFLEDLAIATGAKVFPRGAKASAFSVEMMGGAKKAVINAYSTTIIDGEGPSEDVESRVGELRQQLKEAESLIDREEIKKRISMLTGKISIIRVGAPTEVDRGEIQLRVEDAIAATQSALRDGIVPGGGVALARVASGEFENAFTAPLQTLAENAGYNPSEVLFKVLGDKDKWAGYDFRSQTEKPTSMLKIGIVDPAEVVKEAVRNATSVVGTLITMQVGVTFKDREMKSD